MVVDIADPAMLTGDSHQFDFQQDFAAPEAWFRVSKQS
jgi:hypothetical protein